MKRLMPLFLILGTMSGCATMTTGSRQDVLFTSEPVGADVVVNSRNQKKSFRTTTPGTISLKRRNQYDAIFSKAGYHEVTKPVDHNLWGNNAVFGNILIGGLFGIGVDMVSGAQHKFEKEIYAQLTLLGEETILPDVQESLENVEPEQIEDDTDSTASTEPIEKDDLNLAKTDTNEVDEAEVGRTETSEDAEAEVGRLESNEEDGAEAGRVKLEEEGEVNVAEAETSSIQESESPYTANLILEYSVHSENIPPVNVRVNKEKYIQLGKGENHTVELVPGIHTIKIKDPVKAIPRKPNWKTYQLKINVENGETVQVIIMTHLSGGDTAVTLYVVQNDRIIEEVKIPTR